MTVYQRLPVSCEVYEPVAYDKSIYPRDDGQYNVVIRMDADKLEFIQPTLVRAQTLCDSFQSDVWEGS